MRTVATLIVFLSVSAACGDPATYRAAGPDATTADDDPRDVSAPDLAPDLAQDEVTPDLPGGDPMGWDRCIFDNGLEAECSSVRMPLRRSQPDSPSIVIFLSRVRAPDPGAGQLWLLQGGPGGASDGLQDLAADIVRRRSDLDLYLMDHRGVGRSERLGCPGQERWNTPGGVDIVGAEWDDCARALSERYGDHLADFSTSGAADDLADAVDLTRSPGQDVFVLGFSYGTYWAHRYLQRHPEQATGVVMDSVCPPAGHCDFTRYDAQFNDVGREFLDMCSADSFCAGKLGPDAWGELLAARADKELGLCADVPLDTTGLGKVLSTMLRFADLRAAVPAIIYRLRRCAPGDVASMLWLLELVGEGASTFPTGDSPALGGHILFSELWAGGGQPDPDELARASRAYPITTERVANLAPGRAQWPVYNAPEAANWARTTTPVLMLNGTLDPQTPLATALPMEGALDGPNQHFVQVPFASHTAMLQSPMDNGDHCGAEIVHAWLDDPESPPQLSCLGRVRAPRFEGTPELAGWLFGRADLFENDEQKGAIRAPEPVSWRQFLREYHHR